MKLKNVFLDETGTIRAWTVAPIAVLILLIVIFAGPWICAAAESNARSAIRYFAVEEKQ